MTPATVISSNRRSVSEVTCWFDDLADDYWLAKAWDRIMPVGAEWWTGQWRF